MDYDDDDEDNSLDAADSADSVKSATSEVIASDPNIDESLDSPLTGGSSDSEDGAQSYGKDTSVSSDSMDYDDDDEDNSLDAADSADSVKSAPSEVIASDSNIDESLDSPLTGGSSDSEDGAQSYGKDTSVSSDSMDYDDDDEDNSLDAANSDDTVKSTKTDVISSDPVIDECFSPPLTADSFDSKVGMDKKPKKSFKQAAKEAEITSKIVKTLTVVKLH